MARGNGSHSKTGWISERENALCRLAVKLVNARAGSQSEEKVIPHLFFPPQEVKRDGRDCKTMIFIPQTPSFGRKKLDTTLCFLLLYQKLWRTVQGRGRRSPCLRIPTLGYLQPLGAGEALPRPGALALPRRPCKPLRWHNREQPARKTAFSLWRKSLPLPSNLLCWKKDFPRRNN